MPWSCEMLVVTDPLEGVSESQKPQDSGMLDGVRDRVLKLEYGRPAVRCRTMSLIQGFERDARAISTVW